MGLDSYSLLGEGYHGANIANWIAIKRPQKVRGLCLVSPGPLKEDSATVNALLDDFIPHIFANKDGNWDGSGGISDENAAVVCDYLFSNVNREGERCVAFMKSFHGRYGEGFLYSKEMNHIMNFFRRDPIPADLLAAIKAPVLIIQGSADVAASPLAAAEEWRNSYKSAGSIQGHLFIIRYC